MKSIVTNVSLLVLVVVGLRCYGLCCTGYNMRYISQFCNNVVNLVNTGQYNLYGGDEIKLCAVLVTGKTGVASSMDLPVPSFLALFAFVAHCLNV